MPFGLVYTKPLPTDYYPQPTDADPDATDPNATTNPQHADDHPDDAQDANRTTGSSESFKKLTASTTDDTPVVAQSSQATEEQSADAKEDTKADQFGRASSQDAD